MPEVRLLEYRISSWEREGEEKKRATERERRGEEGGRENR
jgi:hypothetical protein